MSRERFPTNESEQILGLDLGTNSIGYAIVNHDRNAEKDKYSFVDGGVMVFQEGVKIEKGIEKCSRAAERTQHRLQRVNYRRRRGRKISLLRILMEEGLCPQLSNEELKRWRKTKNYPENEEFLNWLATDSDIKNPYLYRKLCIEEKLDLKEKENRYILGRALYHLNQRRGYVAGKEETASDGKVKESINNLEEEMGGQYYSQYAYDQYKRGEKIRGQYTDRSKHCERDLLAICERQGLSEELTQKLHKAIVWQRPLKSQKGTVGFCVFEKNKRRCPISHPLYEQYRLYQFLNNVKVRFANDTETRGLTDEEKEKILPLFLRKSKASFKFKEIVAKLVGKGKTYGYEKDRNEYDCLFNYPMDTTVDGCPTIAQLSDVFGVRGDIDGWLWKACEVYTLEEGKNCYDVLNEIWHVLVDFDNVEKKKEWGIKRLQLNEGEAEQFSQIKTVDGYASLSLKAIRKILPYMKKHGLGYSNAVFLANLGYILPCGLDNDEVLPMLPMGDFREITEVLKGKEGLWTDKEIGGTKEEILKEYLKDRYNLCDETMKKIYHPSMIDKYKEVRELTNDSYFQLGSPRTDGLRNPMALWAMTRLRDVVNELLKKGKIGKNTIIHLETARELNNSNMRSALRKWQRDREKENEIYAKKIIEHFKSDEYVTERNLLKYRLWEEQGGICLYTGNEIPLDDLFDDHKYEVEHTIPRGLGGDSSMENLTLCSWEFNRYTKKNQMPSELANHQDILNRVEGWMQKADKLKWQMRNCSTRGITTKEIKDKKIQRKNYLKMEADYWANKYKRFIMTEVPEGFSRRQGVDAGVISSYALSYMKSVFNRVYPVKGIVTAEFRKLWGIQKRDGQKDRGNHCHHLIDAIVVACIGPNEYRMVAQHYHNEERRRDGKELTKLAFPKPWESFAGDIATISKNAIVKHYTADRVPKQTRKRIKVKGKPTGEYSQGDTARGSLHNDTFYGCIKNTKRKKNEDGKKRDEFSYVVRRPITGMTENNIANVVDDNVRKKLQEALSEGKITEETVWMNEEKHIPIKTVRVRTGIQNPVVIREMRNKSKKEWKNKTYVENDLNYAMGVYVGPDGKGDHRVASNLYAVKHYNNDGREDNIFSNDIDGMELKWVLRKGLAVILNSGVERGAPMEKETLSRHLYNIVALEQDGRIRMKHHQDAGGGDIKEERLKAKNMCAFVENHDFTISSTGEFEWLKKIK